VWEVVGATNLVRSDLVSFPSEVVASTLAMAGSGELGKNTLVSLSAFVQGFVPAVIGGVALGLVIGLVKPVRLLLDPLLVALYSAPRIAFIPILVVWFGVGAESKVVMVFLSAVFPVMINTTTGVQEVSEPWIRAVRAFGASPMQVVTKAVLPAALPAIMAGVRLGLGRAIVGLIAAEMYVSVAGIGRLVQVYSSAGRATQLIVLVVVISAFGFACVTLLRSVEEWLGPWRQELEQ
jgi:NitT/TauT family transport system permease protein